LQVYLPEGGLAEDRPEISSVRKAGRMAPDARGNKLQALPENKKHRFRGPRHETNVKVDNVDDLL